MKTIRVFEHEEVGGRLEGDPDASVSLGGKTWDIAEGDTVYVDDVEHEVARVYHDIQTGDDRGNFLRVDVRAVRS